jgi:hypothetical protein
MKSFIGRETPYLAQHLFDGELYLITSVTSVPAGATINIQGKFGDRLFHTISSTFLYQSGGPYTLNLIESPTLTDGTISFTAPNMNRRSTKTHQAQFFADPTNISGGTIIETLFLPSSGGGTNAAGGGNTVGTERILKANTDYIIQATNSGGQNSTLYTSILFYESGN